MHSLGGVDETLKDQLLNNYRMAEISDEDVRILEFAEKVTTEAHKIKQEDVDALLDFGFDIQAVHDIVQVAAYFNYVNRLADGLGIELEG